MLAVQPYAKEILVVLNRITDLVQFVTILTNKTDKMNILLEKQKHYHFGNQWVTIKAIDYLNRVQPAIIRRNGTKFLSKDINLAKTILKERLVMLK